MVSPRPPASHAHHILSLDAPHRRQNSMCPASTASWQPCGQHILMLLPRRSAELCPIPVHDADLDHDQEAVNAVNLGSEDRPVPLGLPFRLSPTSSRLRLHKFSACFLFHIAQLHRPPDKHIFWGSQLACAGFFSLPAHLRAPGPP